MSQDGTNPTGLGRLFHRRNKQVDEGQFQVRGKAIFLHGYGRKIWEDKLYEGYFVNGNLHGRGKMVQIKGATGGEKGYKVIEGLWYNN